MDHPQFFVLHQYKLEDCGQPRPFCLANPTQLHQLFGGQPLLRDTQRHQQILEFIPIIQLLLPEPNQKVLELIQTPNLLELILTELLLQGRLDKLGSLWVHARLMHPHNTTHKDLGEEVEVFAAAGLARQLVEHAEELLF